MEEAHGVENAQEAKEAEEEDATRRRAWWTVVEIEPGQPAVAKLSNWDDGSKAGNVSDEEEVEPTEPSRPTANHESSLDTDEVDDKARPSSVI